MVDVFIRWRAVLLLALLPIATPIQAQPVETTIRGVDGEMLSNVRLGLSLVQAERLESVSIWRLRQMARDAREEVRTSLQPFGYYNSAVSVRLDEPGEPDQPWRAEIDITPGEPVRVVEPSVGINGEADTLPEFREWLAEWPLPDGNVLRHPPYENHLRLLEQLAEEHGFFEGRFEQRRIKVDPGRNQADIDVRYSSGPRYTFGAIDLGDTQFSEDLMTRLTVLDEGQPFNVEDLDRQREVLVRSAYFEQVSIGQTRDPERDVVELDYRLEPKKPNTYRVLAGFGTDTGARLQLGWTRHYLSSQGNRLDTRFGAQQTDSEFVLRSNYQHPYGEQPGNFLTAEVLLKRERDRFRFEDADRIEPVFDSFGGNRNQAQLTIGRLRERLLFGGDFNPLDERLFVTFLNEQFDAFSEESLNDEQSALLADNPGLRPFLDTNTNTAAFGSEWTLSRLSGDGFAQEGQFVRARALAANESIGSDVSFVQGYATARWHWLFHPRHKLLLRGEVGFTNASTRKFDLSIEGDDRQLDLEITELPELFRFKAGGDRSVRGYAFEALSTNRNGANNLLVGSAEYEYNIHGDFSVAAFYDIGNAFNDFSEPELKRGAGIGVRWYSLIGPVQLDLARSLDDDSLRIHFTIGTKLL